MDKCKQAVPNSREIDFEPNKSQDDKHILSIAETLKQ